MGENNDGEFKMRSPLHHPMTFDMVNENVVRTRAAMLFLVPVWILVIFYNTINGSAWVVDTSTLEDTWETNFAGQIIYQAEMVRQVYDWTPQTYVLLYVLWEMIITQSAKTAWLSPMVWVAGLLNRHHKPIYRPYQPKKFAWKIGTILVGACLCFFNPVPTAEFVNGVTGMELLSTTENWMPRWTPLATIPLCLTFMWLEAAAGWCAGCWVHSLLVKVGIFKEKCDTCIPSEA